MKDKKSVIVCSAAIVLMLLKLILYYSMLDVSTGFSAVVAITFVVLCSLFLAFKRKWIFGIVYTVLSILMVIDVNYFAFFNRSLSITQLGAADLLSGVTESIEELFMPSSLLLLVDAIAFIVLPIVMWRINAKKAKEETGADAQGETCADSGQTACASNSKLCAVLNAINGNCIKTRLIALGVTAAMLVGLVAVIPGENSTASSIFSQEYFSYHLRDFTGINTIDTQPNYDGIYEAGGTYEDELGGKDFGVAEGMNLIVIQVEAMQNFVIGREYEGQEITPFINSLLEEDTYYFDRYYQQTGSGNTSDAEFATNNSLFGTRLSYTYQIYQDNYWRGLPVLLKDDGYTTAAFHSYQGDYWNRENAYPNQGFDDFYSETAFDINEILGMGLSDEELFSQSMDIVAEEKEPFYNFFVTLSSHYPFSVPGKGDIKLNKEDEDTLFGKYLEAMNYYDYCLEQLFDRLKKEGLYDNTVVAFYGDHLGMNPKTEDVQKRMTEYLGWNYDYEDAMNIPLVIHVPGSGKHDTISTPGGHTDFLPTICYLMGYDELDTIYFGHNLINVKNNFVPLKSYLPEGSFVYGNKIFKMSKSGVLSDAEIINLDTHEKDTISNLNDLFAWSVQLQDSSEYYLENDILKQVYVENKSLKQIIKDENRSGYYSSIDYQKKIVDVANGFGKTAGLYCLENLESLYRSGERAFEVNLIWTSDRRSLVMHNVDELGRYFDNPSRITSFETLEKELAAGRANLDVTLITGAKLLDWMKKHDDTYMYIHIDTNQVIGKLPDGETEIPIKDFAESIYKNYPELFDRIIFIAKDEASLVEYRDSGLHNVIFMNDGYRTPETVIDMVTKYDIYGATMDIEYIQFLTDIWVFDDVAIYATATDRTKSLMKKVDGVDGVIVINTGITKSDKK